MEAEQEITIHQGSTQLADVPKYIQNANDHAIKHIENQNYTKALKQLSKSEEILEAVTSQGGQVDPNQILLTLHNAAVCLQRIGNLDECVSYLDACAFNVANNQVMVANPDKVRNIERIKKLKYLAKTHIQICAILSRQERHEIALVNAKKALSYAQSFVEICFKICRSYISKQKRQGGLQNSKARPMSSSIKKFESTQSRGIYEIIQKVYPTFEYLMFKITNKPGRRPNIAKVPKLEMRNVLGVQHLNDWIYNFNIDNMTMIQLLTPYDVKNTYKIQAEFTKDLMLDKLCIMAMSYFCISTEIRYLNQSENANQTKEGRI